MVNRSLIKKKMDKMKEKFKKKMDNKSFWVKCDAMSGHL